MRFTYAIAHFFVAVVNLRTNSHVDKFFAHLVSVIRLHFGNGNDFHLNGSKPQGECACVMFRENCDESLNAAKHNTVNHDRSVLFAVLSHVRQVETFRHLEIQLNGSALPCSANAVFQVEVDFRSVKCAVAFVDFVVLAQNIQCTFQCVGCRLPLLVGTHAVFRTCGKFQLVLESEHLVEFVYQTYNAFDFFLYLVRSHEDVSIVLSKATNTHKSVQRTGKFVTVNKSKFRHTLGQVTVTVRFALVHQHSAGAVHGFDCVVFVVNLNHVHIVFVVIPVSAAMPKFLIENHWRFDFFITCQCVFFAPEIFQSVSQHHSFGEEKRETGTFVENVEKVQFLAQLAVVTAFGFFHAYDVFVQFQLLFKSRAVDTCQHFVFCVPTPIGTGNACKFENFEPAC